MVTLCYQNLLIAFYLVNLLLTHQMNLLNLEMDMSILSVLKGKMHLLLKFQLRIYFNPEYA